MSVNAEGPTADVILAADRGPYTYVWRGGELVPQPRPSAVVRALLAARRSIAGEVAYVSTTTSSDDQDALRLGHFDRLSDDEVRLSPVYVEPVEYRAYYDEVGVRMLWFAHHDLWGELGSGSRQDATAFRAYERVNAAVADRVARFSRTDSLIALHDYQLATAVADVRRLVPGAAIAHFVHTAFATPDSLARLPDRVVTRVLEGMLAADLLCFHCPQWARNFLSCCPLVGAEVDSKRGRVRYAGRQVWVRSYPAPVDAEDVLRCGSTARARWWAMRTKALGLRIVRVDRLDPAKGVLRGFEAFELLLARRPELRGRVTFTAFLVPSREQVTEYRDYAERTWQKVQWINSRHPGSVRVYYGQDRERALGGLREYDVLLVNPVRDGMNLVAQEGPVLNESAGVLVLSTSAGAADVLRDGALLIGDPTDAEQIALLLEQAVAMPVDERRRRAEKLRLAVTTRHPGQWMANQLGDLRRVRDGGAPAAGI